MFSSRVLLYAVISSLILLDLVSSVHCERSTVGILASVDYGWWQRLRSTTGTHREAVDEAEYYFTHLVKEMNSHFATLGAHGLNISIVLQGLAFHTSQMGSPWTEDHKTESEGVFIVNAKQALDSLGNSVRSDMKYSKYDHVILFTSYNLYSPRSDKTPDLSRVGASFQGEICNTRGKVSVVEDNFDFMSSKTACHEIAHNLNATHNGDGNSCLSSNEFIMSPVVGNRVSYGNTFSASSAASISKFISSPLNTCLYDDPEPFMTEDQTVNHLRVLPGQKKSFDAQCRIAVGATSYTCVEPKGLEVSCSPLRCAIDFGCYDIVGLPAFDGTTCGDKKWCIKGKCIPDEEAPMWDESCPYGDSLLTAACDVPDMRLYCNHPANRMLCCSTCAALRDRTKPGCDYGDRLKSCPDVLRPQMCYNDNYRHTCCSTCDEVRKHYLGAPAGCEYGDHRPAGWCKTSSCEEYPLECGGTCHFGEDYPAWVGQPRRDHRYPTSGGRATPVLVSTLAPTLFLIASLIIK